MVLGSKQLNLRRAGGAAALLIVMALVGCAYNTADASTSNAPAATSTPTSTQVTLPNDCRAILSNDVLAQLESIPLNDPTFGPSGVGEDDALTCIWRDPGADTTSLVTTISRETQAPALDILNALKANEDFTCSTSDGGTRCEKTWQNTQYPVTDGRTLFWRENILIDTQYSNLNPTGYTSSIIAHLFN